MKSYITHFCFGERDEQVVSISTVVDQPFEITFSPLEFDHRSPANYLVGQLQSGEQGLELYVQGHLELSGTATTSPVSINSPFMIPYKDGFASVIVTELHSAPLADLISDTHPVSSPIARTEIIRAKFAAFINSVRIDNLNKRKAKLTKELASVDDKLKSNGAG